MKSGFYPLPGTLLYVVGSPVFPLVVIRPFGASSGHSLTILAHNTTNSDLTHNIYVRRLEVNGVSVESPFINHLDLVRTNAKLEFWMTGDPTKSFDDS